MEKAIHRQIKVFHALKKLSRRFVTKSKAKRNGTMESKTCIQLNALEMDGFLDFCQKRRAERISSPSPFSISSS